MVHVVASFPGFPIGVVLPQFKVEAVQAAGRTDVEGVLSDLPYGGDSSQSQKEPETVGEVLVGTGDRLAAGQLLGLKIHAVRGKNELRLGLDGRGAFTQRGQRPRQVAVFASSNVDVVGLENAAEVGL